MNPIKIIENFLDRRIKTEEMLNDKTFELPLIQKTISQNMKEIENLYKTKKYLEDCDLHKQLPIYNERLNEVEEKISILIDVYSLKQKRKIEQIKMDVYAIEKNEEI